MNQNEKQYKAIINYKEKNIELSVKYRKGNNELILFIHGLGCSKDSFEQLWGFPDFKAYSLVTFDLVGFGDSEKTLDFSYDIADQAEICKLLLSQFQYDIVHIVGHSMGGAIGVLLMEGLKSSSASFINVEGNLIGADCGLISRKTISYSFEEFHKNMFNKLILHNKASEDFSSKLWAEMLQKCDPFAFYKSSKWLVKWSDSNKLLDIFLGLKCNKAYIYGDKNSEMDVIGMLNGIKKISISNSGHFMMNDNPNEFYKKLCNTIKVFDLR
ncbi:MAG: alpha/beta fold hydrolase [Solirubrobacterales bacterium]